MTILEEFVKTGTANFHKCRNCGRSLYFGGVFWRHLHSELNYCAMGDPNNLSQADPFTDEDASLLKAAPDLLAALKALTADAEEVARHSYSTSESSFEEAFRAEEPAQYERVQAAKAAIAKAEAR